MTKEQLNDRLAKYRAALNSGQITKEEHAGFVEALRKLATVSFASAGATRRK